jgi:acetyl esterase/lipase
MLVPICHDLVGHESADKLTLMGDSAGGGIALALAQLLRDRHMPRPEHIVLLSPWLDATMSNPEIREIDPVDTLLDIQGLADAGKLYAGPLDPADPMVSPINGSLAGLGLITVFIGTHDLFLADCRRLRALAEAHAIKIDYREYANMVHTWMLYSLPEARQTKKEIIELLGKEFTEV